MSDLTMTLTIVAIEILEIPFAYDHIDLKIKELPDSLLVRVPKGTAAGFCKKHFPNVPLTTFCVTRREMHFSE